MSVHPLREYREKNSLSQEQLAEKLGVSRQMVGLVEAGERPVTAANALKWEPITGIPKERLCPKIFADPEEPKRRIGDRRAAA